MKSQALRPGLVIANLFFFGMLIGSGIQSQPSDPYRQNLRQSDLRARALKEGLLGGQKAPDQLRLRYSRIWLNYAIFYDLNGHEIWYKFREYRFDQKAERKLDNLVAGQAYAVSGKYIGIYHQYKLWTTQQDSYREHLTNQDSIPVFSYESAQPLVLEQLLY